MQRSLISEPIYFSAISKYNISLFCVVGKFRIKHAVGFDLCLFAPLKEQKETCRITHDSCQAMLLREPIMHRSLFQDSIGQPILSIMHCLSLYSAQQYFPKREQTNVCAKNGKLLICK